MSKLAIHGGPKTRIKPFPFYKVIGKEERAAVDAVLKGGVLSQFLGAWHPYFYGGPQVQAFEKEWVTFFKVKHAIAVNSATSGLYAAVGACGIGPGDEVIVSPYSMSCSATAPLIYSAIPVFADIESDYFCLSSQSIKGHITPLTKAIIVVNLFGQPYDREAINALAKKHRLWVIEDCAQAPGAKYADQYAGTLGDIGIFSLNYHKHIHTGEGGMVVTNNDQLADRVRLIRNHAEAVVEAKKVQDLTNMIGFNYRMTEVEAAIGRCQLKKLPSLVKKRIAQAKYVNTGLAKIPGITPPLTRPHASHVYYAQAFKYDEGMIGVSRNTFIEAVKAELPLTKLREAEGVKISSGYVRPIYFLPLFQQKIAFGKSGHPWISTTYSGQVTYQAGICPTVERLYEKELFAMDFCHASMKKADLDDIITAFHKVYALRKDLRSK